MKTIYLSLFCMMDCICCNISIAQHWPQAAGPHGDWSTRTESEVPTSFNVASGENIVWTKQLDESGQSGIVVWEDRIFLTILKPFDPETQEAKETSSIRALCLDASNCEIIWEYEIDSEVQTGYMGGFSDLTSPSPIADGEFVWFTNIGPSGESLVKA